MRFGSALDAIAAGMGMVHQAFKLFASLTVWENIVFGAEPARTVFIDRGKARREVAELAERHGLGVDPDAKVGALSVGCANASRFSRRYIGARAFSSSTSRQRC